MRYLILLLVSLITVLPQMSSAGEDEVYTGFFSDTALSGYDTVAYFKEGKALKGKKKYRTQYKGANWQFYNAENLQLFNLNPEKYAPQYGGYCAYAAADNRTAGGDPEFWSIHNGKLYLSYDQDIAEKWESNKEEIVKNADNNWPQLIE